MNADDAGRMYPVWKWLGMDEQDFRNATRGQNDISNVRYGFCLVNGCGRTVRNMQTLCVSHMGAYHRKRAQVIRSMGA